MNRKKREREEVFFGGGLFGPLIIGLTGHIGVAFGRGLVKFIGCHAFFMVRTLACKMSTR